VPALVLLFALIGLIYGLLFKRLVRLSFIINRGAVYGLTAIVVVGIFALLGALIQSFTIGGNAGLALTLGVSLIVGLGLEAVKKRIDSLVERLFFRRKYIADSMLRRFARQCAFIEDPERLLDEAVAEIREYLQAPSVALYERVTDSYTRVCQRGRNAFPERVAIDDRAFVALRAELTEQDLHTYKSALGFEGYGFPMAVRGKLQGALIVGARPEQYTPDERELLAHVAYQVGMALHALRTRENEKLMRAFASGELEPALARERARQLFSMNL
jgi:23S rRNA maturation mini-RNase III